MGGGGKDTPIMRQYQAAKATQPDALLFFRLGDFYEMFFDDAVTAARELDLTLTSRDKNAKEPVPMAGVPHHAAHGYIAKLVAKGFKVALCEQMADPAKTRGIVPREVVRVVTPGLTIDEESLDARENHFLAAIERTADGLGLAVLDLSTGELRAAALEDDAVLVAELVRAAPREVLLGPDATNVAPSLKLVLASAAIREETNVGDDRALDDVLGDEAKSARRSLPRVACLAAARALRFALACSPGQRLPVTRLEPWEPRDALFLDETAQRHLELLRGADGTPRGSLLELIDATETPGGARLLRRRLLAPLLDVARIRRRHDEVGVFVEHPSERAALREALSAVPDLERLAVRAALKQATPRDLGSLRDGLRAAPRAVAIVASIPDPLRVAEQRAEVDVVPELAAELERALVDRPPPRAADGNIFRAGYDATLDEARELRTSGTSLLAALEARLREETGIATLKVRYTRVFGWYLEVTGRYAEKTPRSWRRKQTVAGGERYTCDELDDLADKVLHAEDRENEREAELFRGLVARVASAAPRLAVLAGHLAGWDVASSLAEVAHRHDYVRPEIDDGDTIDLEDARHPVVEVLAAAGKFVPNDVCLDGRGERLWLLTGPNMAGKSTLMRQVALIVVLAQLGSFVPARRARIGVVDRVLSRVGASDDLARGESTFMVEMRETASILRSATRRSLVILDEIGRGTSTYDGLALAWAVAEHLHDVTRCRALFATHYHELTQYTEGAPGAANHAVSAREVGDSIVFLHKLQRGAASRSYGIAVARLAGLPDSLLARAKSILASLEDGGSVPAATAGPRKAKSRATTQMDLFAPAPPTHPVLDALAAIDPDRLTPLEALSLVADWKKRL